MSSLLFCLECMYVCMYEFLCFFFRDSVSLCSSDCHRTHSVDQGGLKLTAMHASDSWSAGIDDSYCGCQKFFFF